MNIPELSNYIIHYHTLSYTLSCIIIHHHISSYLYSIYISTQTFAGWDALQKGDFLNFHIGDLVFPPACAISTRAERWKWIAGQNFQDVQAISSQILGTEKLDSYTKWVITLSCHGLVISVLTFLKMLIFVCFCHLFNSKHVKWHNSILAPPSQIVTFWRIGIDLPGEGKWCFQVVEDPIETWPTDAQIKRSLGSFMMQTPNHEAFHEAIHQQINGLIWYSTSILESWNSHWTNESSQTMFVFAACSPRSWCQDNHSPPPARQHQRGTCNGPHPNPDPESTQKWWQKWWLSDSKSTRRPRRWVTFWKVIFNNCLIPEQLGWKRKHEAQRSASSVLQDWQHPSTVSLC